MPSLSSSAQQALEALGTRLRELRLDAGMTARELAHSAKWHFTKVSKIENGKQRPAFDEIRTWCELTGSVAQTDDLIATLRSVESAYVEWRRLQSTGLRRLQVVSTEVYERTGNFYVYQSLVVPGLFQTAAYAAVLLDRIADFHSTPNDTQEAVKARMERQRLIGLGRRRFSVVLEESVLRYQVGDADVMAGQLGHLMTVATMPSVSLGIIPFGSRERPMWAIEGFGVFDSKRVHVELLSARVTITQPREVALYLKAYVKLCELAVFGPRARALITAAVDALDR